MTTYERCRTLLGHFLTNLSSTHHLKQTSLYADNRRRITQLVWASPALGLSINLNAVSFPPFPLNGYLRLGNFGATSFWHAHMFASQKLCNTKVSESPDHPRATNTHNAKVAGSPLAYFHNMHRVRERSQLWTVAARLNNWLRPARHNAFESIAVFLSYLSKNFRCRFRPVVPVEHFTLRCRGITQLIPKFRPNIYLFRFQKI